jgi:hypothetical protein
LAKKYTSTEGGWGQQKLLRLTKLQPDFIGLPFFFFRQGQPLLKSKQAHSLQVM